VLRKKEEFEITISRLKPQVEGLARVASIYSVGLSEMSSLEAEFQSRYPEAQLRVDYLRPEKVYAAVEGDEADLGLVSYPEPTKEIAVIPWRQEEMVVAVSPGNPLARAHELRPSDLTGLYFVQFEQRPRGKLCHRRSHLAYASAVASSSHSRPRWQFRRAKRPCSRRPRVSRRQ
jgi:LysR family transcriptional regulator, transcriptional activator of the cysJI operon